MDTGYHGRTGIFEVLLVDDAIKQMILNAKSADEIAAAARREGKLRTLYEDAVDKVIKGFTTLEEAMRVAPLLSASSPLPISGSPQLQEEHRSVTEGPQTEAERGAPAEQKSRLATRRDRVLVVDDDETIRMFIKTLLESEFYEVILATDGVSAMEMIFENPPDLVIIDFLMPGMSGIELVKKMKSHSHLRAIPIVMLTATEPGETEIQSLEAGVDDWIQKPIHGPSLLARVKRRI